MNFGFSDDEQEIKDTARAMLGKRSALPEVRKAAESRTYDDALWGEMRELGWPGIAIPERYGGAELGMVALAAICEEVGYACAASPYLSNAAAGLALMSAGSDEQRERLLPGVASGEARGAVGFVDGDKALVADGEGAAFIALLGADEGHLLEGADTATEPLETIDLTRDYATVAPGGGEPLPGDVAAARDRVSVAVAAELVGLGQRAMELAIEYAKEREQFNRPIGSYQAVSHKIADMFYGIEEARSLTYYAAWTADAEPESLPLAASMAKARASDAGWKATADALQVFGGIGFTWEHDIHLLLKRAKLTGQLFGSPAEHRDRVAGLAGLG